MLLAFVCFCLGFTVYGCLFWLLMPLGRRWLRSRWEERRRHPAKPEAYPNDRSAHWLRGHSRFMYLLLCVPLCVGMASYLWPVSEPRFWPLVLVGRGLLTLPLLWLAVQTWRACREVHDSLWMNARRMVDGCADA